MLEQDIKNPLKEFKEDYLRIFRTSFLSSNEYNEFRLVGLKGLRELVLLENFLEDNEIGVIIQELNQTILNDPDEDMMYACCFLHSFDYLLPSSSFIFTIRCYVGPKH